jgi:putative ABC transport system permease protein
MASIQRLVDRVGQDLRYALRTLRHAPGFTAAAVVTLALGIGATTAVFTLINAVLLRPLPYAEPERIVEVRQIDRDHDDILLGYMFQFLRDHCGTCEAMAARKWSRNGLNLGLGTHAEYVDSAAVSAGYFEVFGVRPFLGRTFTREDERAGGGKSSGSGPSAASASASGSGGASAGASSGSGATGAGGQPGAVVILSHGLWQRVFQGDPHAIGSTVMLGGTPLTVVGVMPASFRPMPSTDVFTPLPVTRNDTDYITVARLKPGITLAQAASDIDALTIAFKQQEPNRFASADWRFRPSSLQATTTEGAQRVLLMLLAAVGLLLLIACANTAGLLIIRAAARRREIATRVALGASRSRIIGQLLTESLLLALVGGALGMLATNWTVTALVALLPAGVTLGQDFTLDRGVLIVALLLSAATGVLFGLLPAIDATRVDVREALQSAGGRGSSGGRSVTRLRHILIVGQVALSVLLLVGAGLLMRTVFNLLRVPTGIDIEQLMTAQMSLQRAAAQADTFDYARFYEQTLERIRALPEVEAAAVVNDLPLTRGLRFGFRFLDNPGRNEPFNPDIRYVTPDYFRVFRVPIVAGRGLTDADTRASAPVALVNQALVRRYFNVPAAGAGAAAGATAGAAAAAGAGASAASAPGADAAVGDSAALGRHVASGSRPQPAFGGDIARAIVGVVGDVRSQPSEPVRPTIYLPVTQVPQALFGIAHRYFPVNWVVRTRSANQANLTAALRDAVHAIDPQQPFSGFRTMTEVRTTAVEEPRSQMLLLSAFATIALGLAAAGIYGLIAYTVVQRTRELGIRLALGATPGRILSRIMLHGVLLAAIGVLAGIAAAVVATRWLQPFVFGISPIDPLTFAITALFLILIAALASAIPAIRAARINPMMMVRSE